MDSDIIDSASPGVISWIGTYAWERIVAFTVGVGRGCIGKQGVAMVEKVKCESLRAYQKW